MANYHLHFNIIQASKGQNIVKEAAYCRATQLYDEKEMKTWQDLKNKAVHLHSEILIPENAPGWAKEMVATHQDNPDSAAEKLWNKVASFEKRKNAQYARTIEFSLPLELTKEQNLILAREFLKDQFALRGMMVDWSVHWKENNPHVHALLTMRALTEDGFGKKIREWNSKKLARHWRAKWEEYQNYHLQLNHHQVRVDHRSYQDQGVDLIPMRHQGDYATSLAKKGIIVEVVKENNQIRKENLARIARTPSLVHEVLSKQKEHYTQDDVLQILGRYESSNSRFSYEEEGIFSNPQTEKAEQSIDTFPEASVEQMIKTLEHHHSVFSEKDIAKVVTQMTDNLEEFTQAIIQIRQSHCLISLGPGDDGRHRYTTKRMLQIEHQIQKIADQLSTKTQVEISPLNIQKALKKYEQSVGKTLTDEQRVAVETIAGKNSLACLMGRAGTGKSFSLGAAKAVWESQGLKVRGVALSGIAADGLMKDAQIESQTIESFKYCLTNNLISLSDHDVVVMDEAGMTDSLAMEFVLKRVSKANAKLILVGDAAQLQPVGPGASFRALLDRLSYVEIKKVYRQSGWQAQATLDFSMGKLDKALSAYEAHHCIHLEKTVDEALQRLVKDWAKRRASSKSDLSQFLVITHRNQDVKALNQLLRAHRISKKEIAEGYQVETSKGAINIAMGDRLLFLKNKRRQGLFNGRFATVKKVDFTETGKVKRFTVILDGLLGKEIEILPEEYHHFTHGYAATVHKVQGMTVDHSFIYAGGTSWNSNLTYVAKTRHRKTAHLYASEEEHRDIEKLKRNLSQFSLKDTVMDFALYLEQYGIDSDYLTDLLPEVVAKQYAQWKNKLKEKIQKFFDLNSMDAQQQKKQEAAAKAEETQKRREDAVKVAQYVDLSREVAISWKALNEKLESLGLPKISYEAGTFERIAATKEYQVLQSLSFKKDEAAHQIYSDLPRYEKALEIHGLDIQKLQAGCRRHQSYLDVKDYQMAHQMGKTVLRDRLASKIYSQIKSHYGVIKACNLSNKALKQHHLDHQKRLFLTKLLPLERRAFKKVESYSLLSKQISKLWAEHFKAPDSAMFRGKVIESENLELKRELLATWILKNSEHCKKALTFFQIGTEQADTESAILTQEEAHKAQKRFETLKTTALRHQIRQRVKSYHQALLLGKTKLRIQLAHEIMRDVDTFQAKRTYKKAVLGLAATSEGVWNCIKEDDRKFKLYSFYRNLNAAQKEGFKAVKRYVDAKQSHARAWQELFESKERLNLNDATFYDKLTPFAKQYTESRNHLAYGLSKDLAAYEAGLKYFNLQAHELNKQAYAHQCLEHVKEYNQAPNWLEKGRSAAEILKDPKAHYSQVAARGLNFNLIRQDAKNYERKLQFDALSIQEKHLLRLIGTYKKINQQVGKQYAHLKENKALLEATSNKMKKRLAKRDYLAWRLLNKLVEINPSNWQSLGTHYRLNLDKLLLQNNQHQEKVANIQLYQAAFEKAVLTAAHLNENTNHQQMDEKKVWSALSSSEQVLHIEKIFRLQQKESVNSYQYAMLCEGITHRNLTRQLSNILELKNHLKNLSDLNKLDLSTVKQAPKFDPILVPQTQAIQKGRLDAKRIEMDLRERAEEVARHYLGAPKSQSAKELRYGSNKGSLAVRLSEGKKGTWVDYQTGQWGNMLKLIEVTCGLDFKEALKEAANFLGGGNSVYSLSNQVEVKKVVKVKAETSTVQFAREIFAASRPIEGTLAERYLREHRGIVGPFKKGVLAYHPNLKNWKNKLYAPALIVAARNDQDEIMGIQAIYLDPVTARKADYANPAFKDIVKLSLGKTSTGSLLQQGTIDGKIAFAEGPETALSVAQAEPTWTVYLTFGTGNFATVPLRAKSDSILFCADNDGPGSGTATTVENAAEELARKGMDVWVSEPEKPNTHKKFDFNDTLVLYGVEKVKKDLKKARLFNQGLRQEQIEKSIDEVLSKLNVEKEELVINASLEKSILPIHSESEPDSLKELLLNYVEMELEQTQLVNAKIEKFGKDKNAAQEYSQKAILNRHQIHELLANAVKQPTIQEELTKVSKIKVPSIARQGGFLGISERLKKGEWAKSDIQALLGQIKNKISTQAQSVHLIQGKVLGRGRKV